MKIFILGHPHTQTSPEFLHHGFTTKIWNQCKIFSSLGYEVIHLGVEGSSPICSEQIDVIPHEIWERDIGFRAHLPPILEPTQKQIEAQALVQAGYNKIYADNIKTAILNRGGKPNRDIACITWGGPQWEAVRDTNPIIIEAGIGYYPQGKCRFRVFESNAWAHVVYAKENNLNHGYWEDAVIPNATDPTRFIFSDKKSDYFLLMGRMNEDKGVDIAIEATRKTGNKLILAGTPGVASQKAIANKHNKHVEFRPNVSEEERKGLMSNAIALFSPTWYPEPFGQVVIEAQLSGTPVIATDWGAFPETVMHGVTGFRCRNINQFLRAVRNIHTIKHKDCYNWALNNFSLSAVAPMWDEYFKSVLLLNESDGWATDTGCAPLNWLNKQYPTSARNYRLLDTN